MNCTDPPLTLPHKRYILLSNLKTPSCIVMLEGQSRASLMMFVRLLKISVWYFLKFSLINFSTKILFSISVALLILISRMY